MEGKHKDHPALISKTKNSEAKLSTVAAFATAHQEYITPLIKMVKSWAPCILQPIAPKMHHFYS